MSIKLIFGVLVLLVLGAWGWQRHGAALLRPAEAPLAPFRFDNDPPRPAPAAEARGGLRKCLKGGQVLYTDGACPEGSKPQAVDGGAVTVVPGRGLSLPTLPALTGASVPTARELLAPPGGTNLREQRMEKIVGK
jgi:hypothetical protein